MSEKNMPLLDHLGELRKVLIVSLLSIVVTSIISFVYVEEVINFLVQPLTALDVKLTFISITEAFMTQIKVAIFGGVILALPVIMYQFWNFILPGLRQSERKYLAVLVPLSIILFLIGLAFAYFTVFRFGLAFLIQAGEGIGAEAQPTMNNYFSFLIAFLLPFGAIFEIPLVVYVLAKLGIVSHQFLAKNRKYAILINFIAAGVLTPGTDVVSQLFMAVPMLILYEISIFIAKVVKPRKVETDIIETAGEEVSEDESVKELPED
jgi:sec-independent protein translocase protein TatC